ncbi:hypothetical protein BIW11_13728 [Tropilaelaps mercedesae]|uniref:Uncharacterized protein n=1 Tax=Tropilaelaps mercedesae TaxID=418985 RepID=A0A1V9X0J5_9ACAR|nr:hypothetical protein BIW11_13728 [Tropilaelaps mercedesae]
MRRSSFGCGVLHVGPGMYCSSLAGVAYATRCPWKRDLFRLVVLLATAMLLTAVSGYLESDYMRVEVPLPDSDDRTSTVQIQTGSLGYWFNVHYILRFCAKTPRIPCFTVRRQRVWPITDIIIPTPEDEYVLELYTTSYDTERNVTGPSYEKRIDVPTGACDNQCIRQRFRKILARFTGMLRLPTLLSASHDI